MDDLEILEMFRNRSEEAIKQCQKKYADYKESARHRWCLALVICEKLTFYD